MHFAVSSPQKKYKKQLPLAWRRTGLRRRFTVKRLIKYAEKPPPNPSMTAVLRVPDECQTFVRGA